MTMRQDASTGQMVDDGQQAEVTDSIDGRPVMNIKVFSPYHTYFDENAFSVSAVNATGPFDILPRHHNFISLLMACILHIDAPTGEKRIRISGGLMHVKADQITIFLDV